MSAEAPDPADIAVDVRDFYDRYPYPPPQANLEPYRQLWSDPQRRRTEFHLFWPWKPYRETCSILIAGCGTRQAARHAVRWPQAQITAIDFSATSVRHTQQLKDRYRLDNLQVRQLALERVAELGTSFDQIVCTGVLHHLPDPAAGLAALRAVLRPDGAMHLMVYAPYGRSGIYMLQEFCRRVGIPPSDSGIEQLLGVLKALPSGHPLTPLLRDARDFGTPAALADALLNPQDRAYSVPQLFGLLQTAGLVFGRWLRQAPYSAQCGVLAAIATTTGLGQLPPAEQFAAAELFRGTMLRHSAIVYRDDAPHPSPPISFGDEKWLAHVPLRLADALCDRERLPAGAVAVLRSRAHAYADTCLPLNARQLRMLEAIDGTRTVAEVLGAQAHSNEARAWFERLWWHDQIVFDASRVP